MRKAAKHRSIKKRTKRESIHAEPVLFIPELLNNSDPDITGVDFEVPHKMTDIIYNYEYSGQKEEFSKVEDEKTEMSECNLVFAPHDVTSNINLAF